MISKKKILAGLTAAAMLSTAALTPVSVYAGNTGDTVGTPESIYTGIDENTFELPVGIQKENENNYEIKQSETFYGSFNDEFSMPEVSAFSLIPEPITFKDSYYDQLDEEAKFAYEVILESLRVEHHSNTVVIPLTKDFAFDEDLNENANEWGKGVIWTAVSALTSDHPELSWLRAVNYSWNFSYLDKGDGTIKLHNLRLNFNELDADCGNYSDIENAVSAAVKEINTARGEDKSVYNTLLQINNYLCRNISYNYAAADDEDTTYSEAQKNIYQTAYSAFFPCNGDKEIKTVCAGYTRAFKLLCDVYDIPCVYVSGNAYPDDGDDGPHAWNYVKVGDDWWAVDVTWNDNARDDNAPYNDYFLVAANDLTDPESENTFEKSHRTEGMESGIETVFFRYPDLKDSGKEADPDNECPADSEAAQAAAGDGDLSKIGSASGTLPTADEDGNILIKPNTFPDEDLRKLAAEKADTNKDGKLSEKELSAVTEIDISETGIAYLNGIEYFSALKTLKCAENIITDIDVSKNTALEVLDCSGNFIESIDTSQNTSLKVLNCSENKIKSLDISKNTALTDLDCSGNLLESLDISKNTALKSLGCEGSGITFTSPVIPLLFPDEIFREWVTANADTDKDGILSADEVSAVKSINVSGLGISDLRGIGYFTSLKELDCSENELTYLDVKYNTELVSLDNTGNDIDVIDISNNPAMKHLNTDAKTYYVNDDTELISLNGIIMLIPAAFPDDVFRDWVSKNADTNNDNKLYPYELRYIRNVDISGLGISDLSGIEYLIYMTKLDCSGNELTSLDISKNTALESLACSGNKISDLDVSLNTNLKILNGNILINSAVFPDENFMGSVKESADTDNDGMLSPDEINAFKTLDVSQKDISDLKGIEYLTSLTALNCSGNRLESLDISKNTALTALDCSGNQLTGLNVSKNTSLDSLKCSENLLKSIDLSNNSALTSLECFGNMLTTLSVSKNAALKTLDCFGNQLTGLNLGNNTVLKTLDCSENQIKSLDISKNAALTDLNCSGNVLTALDTSKNTKLTVLNCSGNQLKSLDISKNTALTTLDCSDNQLKSLDISNNTELVNLDYTGNPIKELIKDEPSVTTAASAVTTVTIPVSSVTSAASQPETIITTTVIPAATDTTTASAAATAGTTLVTVQTVAATASAAVTSAATTIQVLTTASVTSSAAATAAKTTPAKITSAAATTASVVTRPATSTTASTTITEAATSFTVPATVPETTTTYYGVNVEISSDMLADLSEDEVLFVAMDDCEFTFDSDSIEIIKEVIGDSDFSLDYSETGKETLLEEIDDEYTLEAIEEYDSVMSFGLYDTDGNRIVFSTAYGGTVTVTVPYEAPEGTETVEVYNINTYGDIEINNDAEYDPENNTITFSATDDFPYYGIKAMDESGEALKKPELPQTGNNAPANYIIAASAILLAAAGTLAIFGSGVIRRRKEDITENI